MISITKTFEFAASHKLWRTEWDDKKNKECFGKCSNLHGHNYLLEVSLSGAVSSEDSMILDTAELKKIVVELIISELDHRNLNEVSWLKEKLPTSEVLVSEIWDRIKPVVESIRPGVFLRRVRLWETRTIYAEREA